MRHKNQCKGDSGFLIGAVLGGLIGAGAALLLAPKSGEETRKDLKQKADEMKVKTNLASKEARDKVEEVKGSMNDVVNDVRHTAYSAADKLERRIRE